MAKQRLLNDPFQSEFTPPGQFDYPLFQEHIHQIHNASMKVLSKTGFRFDSDKAIDLFKRHGFSTQGKLVFFTEKDVLSALATIPKTFTILARNPRHNITMEPGSYSFGMGRGAINIVNPDGTYNAGTKADLIQATKLCHCLDLLEHWNPLVYPVDVNPSNLHLWMNETAILHTDKPYLYKKRDDIDLIALAYGTSKDAMAARSDCTVSFGQATGIVSSPLSMSTENCEDLMEYARCGIVFHIASMPVAATSAPATLAGTIVQQNAENLAPIVLSQLVRPGCPVFFGTIGGRADMQSLRPRFGVPEAQLIERAGAQMARFYGFHCRGGVGLTDAPSSDFQAGAQAMLSAVSVLKGGPNFLPACGLLGSYIGASLAKVILDVELINQVQYFLNPIRVDEESLAIDIIDEIGPEGNFLQHDHTIRHFRHEFLTESIFPSPDYEKWTSLGKRIVVYQAHDEALRIIDSYEQPPLDPGLKMEVESYVKNYWRDS